MKKCIIKRLKIVHPDTGLPKMKFGAHNYLRAAPTTLWVSEIQEKQIKVESNTNWQVNK